MRVDVNSSHIQLRSSSGNLVLRVKYQVSNGQVKFVVRDVEAFLKNYFGSRPKLDTQLLLSSLGMALEDHFPAKLFPMIDHREGG